MEPDIGQKLRFLPTLPPLDAIGGGGGPVRILPIAFGMEKLQQCCWQHAMQRED